MFRRLEEFVTSYGNFGKCFNCDDPCESTGVIRGRRFCEGCKELNYPKEDTIFRESDATFKCRAENCGAEKLSFREFFIGSCCEAALAKEPYDFIAAKDEHEIINKIYLQTKKERHSSLTASFFAKRELRSARESLKKAQENVLTAEDKCKSTALNVCKLRSLHEKSEKRVLLVTKVAFQRHEWPAAKKARHDEVNEKHQCRICLHPYDDDRQEAIIIPCAHKFCFYCIAALHEKKCPNCRAYFTVKDVYKTH
ncbi:Oidioi.mRNA.OKI2018_I69.chr1.g1966.t2.cds [Oikopleura dioica]|uniref:Oidioi.mRNA.OKI2018_I69.chr1.g1966.t2.cds n=1 Tax=Oikopleura dioica TaxID=34765 RepID=A0ABN7SYR0_OIKDI|nr:Oidioi.mRNA.OKI2018_I69.chr1.g1966.t2.cds [Oikopleura dioica]